MKWHTIIYKSGAKVHFQAENVAIEHITASDELTHINVSKPNGNKPLHFGLSEIAAVWVGKV